ncbi:MAG: FAD-dependent oxidoreductase [Magnetovibrio sp.]|nr:FAD-dependent oxidoreductase [Magnetovibrio sp.]
MENIQPINEAVTSVTGDFDVIVIGAGVIGACTVYELVKKGLKVLAIDKGPEAGYGSTSASCAIIRTYYSAYETCALAYEGWHYWKDWAKYTGLTPNCDLISYHDVGCLVIKTPHNKYLLKVCQIMDEVGCPYEHIATEDIHKWLPGVDTRTYTPAKRPQDTGFCEPTGSTINGAVFFPRGGYVNDPKLSAVNAYQAAIRCGAQFLFNAEVTSIKKLQGRVAGVGLSDGRQLYAPVVINIAGPHSFVINRLAGVEDGMKIKTRALRHEVAHVPAPKGYDTSKLTVYSDSDICTYSRPASGNNLLLGSEDPECDPREWIDNPDTFDGNFTEQWRTMVMRMAQRLPELGIPEQARGVVGLYDVSDDWMPIYDKSDLPGYYMAVGTSGNQFKNAPVAGKLMAQLVMACEKGHDHDNDPLIFHLENINREISLGAFSRRREVNKNSSFSVIG